MKMKKIGPRGAHQKFYNVNRPLRPNSTWITKVVEIQQESHVVYGIAVSQNDNLTRLLSISKLSI